MMSGKFDPVHNDLDRHTQYARDDARDRISAEAGGIHYVPEDEPFPPSAGAEHGPCTPPAAVREEWREIYADMSEAELWAEDEALHDELLELAGLPYVDEHGHGMNEMKRELIRERLAALGG